MRNIKTGKALLGDGTLASIGDTIVQLKSPVARNVGRKGEVTGFNHLYTDVDYHSVVWVKFPGCRRREFFSANFKSNM